MPKCALDNEEARKEAEREYQRQWRIANPERVLENRRRYQAEHGATLREKRRRWYAEHKMTILEKNAAWRAAHPKRNRRNGNLKHKYGIDEQEYARLFEAQGGKCAICGEPPGKKPLAVDHDHETGVVRGLLCHRCNTGIGNFRDEPALLLKAAAFLSQTMEEK